MLAMMTNEKPGGSDNALQGGKTGDSRSEKYISGIIESISVRPGTNGVFRIG
jgi:hypothetical protein